MARRTGFEVRRPYVLAHRGASGYAPENTFAAFDRAIEMGAPGAETDVRATADGVLVLLHDRTLDRTTNGHGPVTEQDLASVQALDAGSWMDPRFAGERIPTADAFLERYGGRLALTLEVMQPGIEATLVALVRARGLLAPQPQPPARPGLVALPPIVFSSTRAESLLAIKAVASEAVLALNGPDFDDAALDAAAAAGFAQVCPHGINCTPQRVAAARARGLSVRASGVLTREALRSALDAGVDGMTCNWPDWVVAPPA
jgi:glycerophosphoryl diester phosphodiesterase